MSIYFVILFFLFTVYTRNLIHCEGKLLRVRLIIYRLLTFSFKKLINTRNVHKVLQEKYFMSNMSYLILIYSASY